MSSTDESTRYVGENLGEDPPRPPLRGLVLTHPLTPVVGGGTYTRRLVASWMSPRRRRVTRRRQIPPLAK
ncbi:UNVERIFIED_CONTAM: hypothetical protein Slati_1741900 [Sesamum latifolium]|uniref:Uncharacterized protein n=1 Tax=Sesamum latifolium TaxID=2727402 RepID=A0AAW2WWS7_9LAMI